MSWSKTIKPQFFRSSTLFAVQIKCVKVCLSVSLFGSFYIFHKARPSIFPLPDFCATLTTCWLCSTSYWFSHLTQTILWTGSLNEAQCLLDCAVRPVMTVVITHYCTCQCPWLPVRWDCWGGGQSGGLGRSSPWRLNAAGHQWTTGQGTWTRTGPGAAEEEEMETGDMDIKSVAFQGGVCICAVWSVVILRLDEAKL